MKHKIMAQLLVWNENYSVGVKEIDEQHQKMVGIINSLYEAIEGLNGERELPRIINDIVEYSNYHFAMEEKYFHEFSYEETAQHIREHNEYRKRANGFLNNHAEANLNLSFDILNYLEDWWLTHINNTDKRYATCFREHGLH